MVRPLFSIFETPAAAPRLSRRRHVVVPGVGQGHRRRGFMKAERRAGGEVIARAISRHATGGATVTDPALREHSAIMYCVKGVK